MMPEDSGKSMGRTLEGMYPWMGGGREERRLLQAALLLAVAVHLWLFVVHWPRVGGRRESPVRGHPILVYQIQQPRFVEERPRPRVPRPARTVPIPDPTPDEPEVLRPVEEPAPELPVDDMTVLSEVPPPPPLEEPAPEVVEVGQVSPPRVIQRVEPRYPRVALAARLQGAVVLDLIIAKDGSVESIRVLNGLPMGLTESAVAAVRQWRFEPSTFRGRPVKVHYRLTVRFSLQ